MALFELIHGAPARRRAGARSCAARPRRGATSWAGILLIAALGGAGVGAVVLGPRFIIATDGLAVPSPVTWPKDPEHRVVLEQLATFISKSHAVLGVNDRGSGSPLLEVVLWVDDRENPGVIDASEVALVAHSRLLETIRLHRLPRGTEAPPLAESDIARDGFCARWRDDVRVGVRTLATGVREMRLDEAAPELSRLSLIWSGETDDQSDAGNVLVDARSGPMTP